MTRGSIFALPLCPAVAPARYYYCDAVMTG